ncbi:MAG: hypothetical protein ACK5HY_17015 [Parahaliea sp.]
MMLSDADKQRLQAGFDGELPAGEWRRLQVEFAGNDAAAAWLHELERLAAALDAAAEVVVPPGLAGNIKSSLKAPRDTVQRVDFNTRGRPVAKVAAGLALAASLLLAVGVGMQFGGVTELGKDSQLRSRMTGTLLDVAAMEARHQWQWQGMDARAMLMREASGLVLDLELEAAPRAELVLALPDGQWRWRQDAGGEAQSGVESSVPGQLRLAVQGDRRYRFHLEPATRDGEIAHGRLPAPRIEVSVEQGGEQLHQGAIVPH